MDLRHPPQTFYPRQNLRTHAIHATHAIFYGPQQNFINPRRPHKLWPTSPTHSPHPRTNITHATHFI